MTEHKLFKVNQDAVLINDNKEVLLLSKHGKWQLPGGRLEEGETVEEGLLREIKEETGIENCSIESIIHTAVSNSGETHRVSFLCHVAAEVSVVLSDEHTAYVWAAIDSLNRYDFTHSGTRDILEKALKSIGISV